MTKIQLQPVRAGTSVIRLTGNFRLGSQLTQNIQKTHFVPSQ